jgi:beta-lactamase superfamily II metal-dependent hydrolase
MTIVKSFAVGNGDMFYIRHNSDNFSIIDCSLPDDRRGSILAELTSERKGKGITRVISTHPDQDHIRGLVELDDHMPIVNFYCVKNSATKQDETADFKRYKSLRDGEQAFYIYKDCGRRWMNQASDERGSAGISILWPDTSNADYQSALTDANKGLSPNNISCVVRYALTDGASFLWLGDLETDMMEKIESEVKLDKTNIVFAPHHGRASGRLPKSWLDKLDPDIIVIGEAPSEHLHYYSSYNTITQNTCGDIVFDAAGDAIHIYVADNAYSVNFLNDIGLDHLDGRYYIGTLYV